MQHRRLSMVLVAALVLTASACGRSQPPPSPSPSPVATSSPSPTVDASAEALYAEAERVYLAYQAAREKFSLTGDYVEFPPEIADYLSPDYLEIERVYFDEQVAAGNRLVGGAPKHYAAPALGTSKDQSVAALAICYDARGLTVVNREGVEVSQGVLSSGIYYFNHYEGKLRIVSADIWEAESCSIE